MSSDAAFEQQASSNGYVQRAVLLADLGRYDEAATELGYAVALEPANARVLTVLARVHLAAGRAGEALSVADAAVAAAQVAAVPAASGLLSSLVSRAFALIDLRRYAEAARTADEILALGPADGYAQTSAAAILAEARNGQQALNAAWRGVELAPVDPPAHLVLSLVTARLGLFDLAERAYREALRLDPGLAEIRHDIGVIRLEQRRYAAALEGFAEVPAIEPAGTGTRRTVGDEVRRLVLLGAGYAIAVVVMAAVLAAGNGALSRIWAAVTAIIGAVLGWALAARVPGRLGAILPRLLRTDRSLALAVYAVLASPCLILLYALVGTPWPLVLAIVAAALAELAIFGRTRG